MKKAPILVAIIVVAAVGGYFAWGYFTQPPPPAAPPPTEAPAPRPVAPAAAPVIRYPIEPGMAPVPPLALDASDGPFSGALAQLLGKASLPGYFHPEKIIRRIVATVDNLPRKQVSLRLMPVEPVAGAFRVVDSKNEISIDPANSARYNHYVAVLQSVDPVKLVDTYVKFYPLFQRAYQDLGYPSGYFNDRLVEVLDDLLAAPDVSAPVALTQPHVLYEFADPELEARSAGQKMMIRMGGADEKKTKAVLRAIRGEITRRAIGK
jgi:hypothetical protein